MLLFIDFPCDFLGNQWICLQRVILIESNWTLVHLTKIIQLVNIFGRRVSAFSFDFGGGEWEMLMGDEWWCTQFFNHWTVFSYRLRTPSYTKKWQYAWRTDKLSQHFKVQMWRRIHTPWVDSEKMSNKWNVEWRWPYLPRYRKLIVIPATKGQHSVEIVIPKELQYELFNFFIFPLSRSNCMYWSFSYSYFS